MVMRAVWMWVNPDLMAQVDGEVPSIWEEFNTLARSHAGGRYHAIGA